MENKKYILLDFDDVLFNTKKFRTDIIKLFSRFGVSRKIFYQTYKDFPVKHKNGSLEVYDPEKQFRKIKKELGINTEKLKKEFYKLVFSSDRYIFPDAKKFLAKFKNENLYIISYGKGNFQRLKIIYSGIDDYLQKVIILDKSKSEALPALFKNKKVSGKEIYFLDDRAMFIKDVKKKYPEIKTFLVRRKEGRYKDEKTKYCDFVIKNFKEAQKIILNS